MAALQKGWPLCQDGLSPEVASGQLGSGVDDLVAPGARGGNPNYWPDPPRVQQGFDGESQEDFPTIKGGAVCAQGPGNADGWGNHGAGGNVIIYEYYPTGWTDPNANVRLKF